MERDLELENQPTTRVTAERGDAVGVILEASKRASDAFLNVCSIFSPVGNGPSGRKMKDEDPVYRGVRHGLQSLLYQAQGVVQFLENGTRQEVIVKMVSLYGTTYKKQITEISELVENCGLSQAEKAEVLRHIGTIEVSCQKIDECLQTLSTPTLPRGTSGDRPDVARF